MLLICSPEFILEVEVISGQKLPKPNKEEKGEVIDPFVELQVHGISQDDTKVMATKVVDNNGFNPIWKETFRFERSSSVKIHASISIRQQKSTFKFFSRFFQAS